LKSSPIGTSHKTSNISAVKLPAEQKLFFDVVPGEIIFKQIAVNQLYESTALVRNLSSRSLRVRIFQPDSHEFQVDYELTEAISPGLATKFKVTFFT